MASKTNTHAVEVSGVVRSEHPGFTRALEAFESLPKAERDNARVVRIGAEKQSWLTTEQGQALKDELRRSMGLGR